jgi:hypothetical protein
MAGKRGQHSKKVAVIDQRRSRVLKRGTDGRSKDMRFLKAMRTQLIEDLGGREDLSIQQLALIEEAAFGLTRMQRLKMNFVVGESFDDRSYAALVNAVIGIFGKLGIHRKAKRILSAQELIAREASTP